ncbi:acetyl/propionyl/methylcrotonyl-CoA carboxylase subunit alpha [Shimia sp. FJ5]|uniref:acetyl-CoA carboxylase biotin carboxylase subunit n=1 Tax=Shimia sp. FJ5 TaxID=3079054 RepID=UPI002619F082|nr:acetyl/propionyl/methylcrotonyl-CoA carboxylase subunit alpha [Shimia sp. FJ5]MDV4146540.1 acetyl/propionyl/methylcrotonyl-CoA carboxylase subunit alpha [Shimia sp. FJ5]
MTRFDKILIANRGEIAMRVIRTAHDLGFRTVAVYSEADKDAPHVQAADEAVLIGAAAVGESYLNAEAILDAARSTGAEAVHPGYGFLSENADFARACGEAGLVFIGPSPEAIALMGSKRLSKLAMLEAGVPCVPGYQGADQSDDTLLEEAARIGFPLMIKASAGGGGRGMRIVTEPSQVAENLVAARSEALSAFGSDELILERAVLSPRHIEIQVFADAQGNVVHLGERDCSIQRRHQKVVEEAPSPFVTPQLRAKMGAAAVDAARACDYRGAGTVEFLVDAEGAFYFLEMNTRLQVEHPVTEAITGLDLVEWQLRVAQGETLPLAQDEITFSGWAMEVRLYAEDPQNGFLPQTGPILHWQPAEGPGLRMDSGIATGQAVSSHYDPMLAKLVASGATREDTRRKLARAVEETSLLGVRNNLAFLAKVLRHPTFAEGEATTDFLGSVFTEDTTLRAAAPDMESCALATALTHTSTRAAHQDLQDWRNTPATPWRYRFRSETGEVALNLSVVRVRDTLSYEVRGDAGKVSLDLIEVGDHQCIYMLDGVRRKRSFALDGDILHLETPSGAVQFENITHAPKASARATGSGRLLAPMDGAIVALRAKPGERVARGQTLAVLEAMKMEHPIKADIDGTLSELPIREGDQVRMRQLLATVSPDATDSSESHV